MAKIVNAPKELAENITKPEENEPSELSFPAISQLCDLGLAEITNFYVAWRYKGETEERIMVAEFTGESESDGPEDDDEPGSAAPAVI